MEPEAQKTNETSRVGISDQITRLTQQRDLARADAAAAEHTIHYVTERLAEQLDDAGFGSPETLPDCLEVLHKVLGQLAARGVAIKASTKAPEAADFGGSAA